MSEILSNPTNVITLKHLDIDGYLIQTDSLEQKQNAVYFIFLRLLFLFAFANKRVLLLLVK